MGRESGYNAALVTVNGGTLKLENGGKICGHTNNNTNNASTANTAGGVMIYNTGTFNLTGGVIESNTTTSTGNQTSFNLRRYGGSFNFDEYPDKDTLITAENGFKY
jgi:hypothetical protein